MTGLSLFDSFRHLGEGLAAVFALRPFIHLCIGVFMGFWVGILPGVGGPAALALLIPFTFTMDPFSAFALLLGLISVTSTAGDITAILFGIPGETANAAIMVDGLPMAKRGEAGRALGAALTSSLLGAIIGACFLGVGIIIIRPLVLSIGYAQFFMLSLAGIMFLASLSAKAVFKGLASGALGLLLSVVGMSQVTGIERFTFGNLFLWDGIGFIPAILGLFAIPELIEMTSGQSRLPPMGDRRINNAWQGAKDAFRHIGLVFRCSAIATYIGIIPGMGASIAQWVAYGHAAQTAKERNKIGRGAIEGVIGPGAACTATQSGALIPTLGFGVPGSPQTAILLGAFVIQGLTPGPAMLMAEAHGGHLTLSFSMVWMIIVANVIVVAASFLFLNQIAKVADLDENLLIPFILVLLFIGAFANKNELADLWVCLAFGLVGWIMVRLDWPRPPLILGLVLGSQIESNLFLTLQAYGLSWLRFPSVIAIFVAIVFSIAWPFLTPLRALLKFGRPRADAPVAASEVDYAAPATPAFRVGETALALILVIVFVLAIADSVRWPYSASLMPLIASIAGIVFASVQLWMSAYVVFRTRGESDGAIILHLPSDAKAAVRILAIYLGYFALVYLAGFVYATALFVIFYLMRFSQLGSIRSTILGVVCSAAIYFGFQRLLKLPLPDGLSMTPLMIWVKSLFL